MFPVILLAAGRASRLGEPKGLFRVEGAPWLFWQLARLARAGVQDVILVVGFRADAYLAQASELARHFQRAGGAELRVVVNPTPELGPFSSLQVGLRALGAGGACVLPVDTPAPDPAVWRALHGVAADAVVPRWETGLGDTRGGHPVRLSESVVRAVLALCPEDPEARLDRVLARHEVVRVPVEDARVALNLNTRLEWLSMAPLALADGPLRARARRRATLVCVRDGSILALRVRDPRSGIEYAFPPGGGIEADETPAQAARRELREETGFEARVVEGVEAVRSYFFAWAGVLLYLRTHFLRGCLEAGPEPGFLPDDPVLLERVWIPVSSASESFADFPAIHGGIMSVVL